MIEPCKSVKLCTVHHCIFADADGGFGTVIVLRSWLVGKYIRKDLVYDDPCKKKTANKNPPVLI
jgi:hypothetical protein